jgi:hypothetical protein
VQRLSENIIVIIQSMGIIAIDKSLHNIWELKFDVEGFRKRTGLANEVFEMKGGSGRYTSWLIKR